MPDIAMCLNKSCPSVGKCYRAQATPTLGWQSYMSFVVPKRRVKCDHFMPIRRPPYAG